MLQRMTDELMVIYSDKFSDKVPERSIEKILPSQTKCPKLEQSKMSDRRRKDEDVCCYNCKECGHYARDCLLPKRTKKELRTRLRGYSGR